jgi:hypothetical protein
MKVFRWLLDFWFQPIAAERLLLWQRIFTITFLIYIGQWAMYASEWLTVAGYHPSAAATDNVFPAPFPLLPSGALLPFLLLMFGSATLLVFGVGGRIAKLLVFGCAVYIQIADQLSSFTLNKLYIMGFFLIAFAPNPRPQGASSGALQSAWPVRILQTTLIIQYVEAGICKAYHGDWMHKFDILYGHSVGVYRTEIAGWLMNHMPPWFWVGSSVFALGFELGAALLFMVPKLRWAGILLGTAMHLVIAVLMKDLIFFSR